MERAVAEVDNTDQEAEQEEKLVDDKRLESVCNTGHLTLVEQSKHDEITSEEKPAHNACNSTSSIEEVHPQESQAMTDSLDIHDFSQLRQEDHVRHVPTYQDIYYGTYASQLGEYERKRLKLMEAEKKLARSPTRNQIEDRDRLAEEVGRLREVVWGRRLR